MIAVDTNILIYAHRSGATLHTRARSAIERAADSDEGWGIPLPAVAEFWAQVTHPQYPDGPSPHPAAARFIRNLVTQGGAIICRPGVGFEDRLLALAEDLGVSGHRVFDLQIALAALDAGAVKLWTHDAHFVKVAGMLVEDPLQ